MNDQAIMENLLLTTKGVCDLYLHGAIESATPNVHQTFSSALNSALCTQNQVYQKMAAKGWYTTDAAQQQKIDQVRQKFAQG